MSVPLSEEHPTDKHVETIFVDEDDDYDDDAHVEEQPELDAAKHSANEEQYQPVG